MKLFYPFKGFLISFMLVLYVTGVVVFLLSRWFLVDRGFGPEPSVWKLSVLQIHSIVGLGFIFLFGYLWPTHIVPGWRRRRKRLTGFLMTAACVILLLTVPLLFYATQEAVKSAAVWLHTYLGLGAVLPLLAHMTSNSK